ncbi:hypothetical protein [Actinokineospora xionganensis]|uniref:Uncharacterized protein n=1 Tax=Actinokineospora xionganensis TaxID=2684470 RepID=A0ABR7L0J3_9PSEU|nr:hypothetical protein [Actinokineospora xionganensis]MBC6445998.1 hypothetical protein [Actinokineospora xionganensis]
MLLRTTTVTAPLSSMGASCGSVSKTSSMNGAMSTSRVPLSSAAHAVAMEDVLADRVRQVGVNPTHLGQHAGRTTINGDER